MNKGAPRVTPKGNRKRTPGQQQEHIDSIRAGLLGYLTARRERLGMTQQDVRESPEEVLRRQRQHELQQALVDDYMQTRVSVDTM